MATLDPADERDAKFDAIEQKIKESMRVNVKALYQITGT